MHRLLDHFWRHTAFPYREIFADADVAFPRAELLVRVAYVICFGYTLSFLRAVPGLETPVPEEVLWQVAWVRHVPFHAAVYAVLAAAAAGCLLAAMYSEVRLFRIWAFAAFFEFQGLRYSDGKIDHSSHTWVFALFLLIFLTRLSRPPNAAQKRGYLEIFWGIQLVTFACYSIAGIQKLQGAWTDWRLGEMSVLNPEYLGVHVAHLSMRGAGGGVLEWLVFDYSWLAGPLTLFMLYLELAAVIVAFRPRLHRYWAAAFMLMHGGTALIMNVWFDPMITMVGLFLLLSPFDTRPFALNPTLRDVPWLGPPLGAALSRVRKRAQGPVTIFYDAECGMCSRFVQLLLWAGAPAHFRFASQKGAAWRTLVTACPYLEGPDTVVVLSEEAGVRQVRIRSEGILWTLAQLPFPLALLWWVMFVPMPVLNLGYRLIARLRGHLSRMTGQACPVPPLALRDRFID